MVSQLRFLGLLLYCMLAASVGADTGSLSPSLDTETRGWTTYNAADGLGSNFVRAIVQDTKGFLWFGTTGGGVTRYDGQRFQTFTVRNGLPGNMIVSACVDQHGRLWVGTWNAGVAWYDGERFHPLRSGEDWFERTGIIAILEDQRGILWFGTMHGLVEYDGTRFRRFTVEDGMQGNAVTALYQAEDGALWIGHGAFSMEERGVSCFDGEQFHTYALDDGLVYADIATICGDRKGNLWFGAGALNSSQAGLTRYDGQQFETFTTANGLPNNRVRAIYEDGSGDLWFGTTGGLCQFDGQRFRTFTTDDGLAGNDVVSIYEDHESNLWFGTVEGGVSRYAHQPFYTLVGMALLLEDSEESLWFRASDGTYQYDGQHFHKRFVDRAEYMFEDSQNQLWLRTPDKTVLCDGRLPKIFDLTGTHDCLGIFEDSRDRLWFESQQGIHMYNGETIREFRPDLTSSTSRVSAINEDRLGRLWFGAFRWDGHQLEQFTTEDGLLADNVSIIERDTEGNLWLGARDWSGAGRGITRYDGERFQKHLTPGSGARCVLASSQGGIWIGTWDGLIWYDGQTLHNFTTENGLSNNIVNAMCEDREGHLWLSTASGLSVFDGRTFQTLNRYDGLMGEAEELHWNRATIRQVTSGDIWFNTNIGAVRYRRPRQPARPRVHLVGVDADRRYESWSSSVGIHSTADYVTFHYQGMDFRTRIGGMLYSYKLEGYDKEWGFATSAAQTSYAELAPGRYTFHVQAIGRDLDYSQPASVTLTVVSPFYRRAAFLIPVLGGGGLFVIAILITSALAIQHRRQVRAYEHLAVQELQDARSIQLSLFPKHVPVIKGAEIAGKCVTANTVGGDFFSYLPVTGTHGVGLVVADVSGKAMRGAMYAVLADGVLSMAMEEASQVEPAYLMTRINNTLTFRMESDMNVTMVIALLDTHSMTLTLANAAHHAYPVLVRNGELIRLMVQGLPLGMRTGVEYREDTYDLQSGDILVLMTDGIIETHDANGNMYGDSGRLEQLLTGFNMDVSAKTIVDALIQDAIDYAAGERKDDTTVVIAKIA